MVSIAREVSTAIEQDVIARRALEKGIISMKNLAVYLIKKNKLHASNDAVISAIRRYKEDRPLEKRFEAAQKVIAQSESIRITTHITEITLEKTKHTQDLMQKVFSVVHYEKGDILLIVQGEQSIKLMVNDKNKARVIALFPKESIQGLQDAIAEVNITLSKEAVATPGILSVVYTELMVHDINIVETMSCVPELLIFVKQHDVVKTYELLSNLCAVKTV